MLTVDRRRRRRSPGRGECVPYARYGETLDSVTAQIAGLPASLRPRRAAGPPARPAPRATPSTARSGTSRPSAPAAASGSSPASPSPGRRSPPTPSRSTPPRRCAPQAARHAHRPLLKIKLGGEGDMARLEAVRAGAPARAHRRRRQRGLDRRGLRRPRPGAASRLGVELVEQPLPAGADERARRHGRARCRSAPTRAATTAPASPALAGKYDMVNIKLDKTGGLTEALALRDRRPRAPGFGVMVGCMVGSSLGDGARRAGGAGRRRRRSRRPAAAWRVTARIRCVYDERGRASVRRRSSGGEHEPHRLRERRLPAGGGGDDQRLRPRLPLRRRRLRGDERARRQARRLPRPPRAPAPLARRARDARARRPTPRSRRSTASSSPATP